MPFLVYKKSQNEEIYKLRLDGLGYKRIGKQLELSSDSVKSYCKRHHYKEIQEDNFNVDEALTENPISKQGDIWLLGKHRLVCGDSTDIGTYTKLMKDKKANLVVTDPPYGVDYQGKAGSIQNDKMKDDDFYQFLLDAFTRMSNCIVLAPFGGSGSTLIACEKTNRICHIIELDEKFVDVIVKRYIEYKGTDDEVYLVRNGKKIKYKDLEKEGSDEMKLTLEKKLAHGSHPVLRWMMDNIFIKTDPAGNIKPDKEKSTEKIDGAVALIMALDRAIRHKDDGGSVYDDRGILIL